jgi:hypothetical protein
MRTRNQRRRQSRRLYRIGALLPAEQPREASRLLMAWRQEARLRADRLDAPAVWALAQDPSIRAAVAALDPSGELQADLDRVCAEAIARAAGPSLVRGSRPVADRGRLMMPHAPARGSRSLRLSQPALVAPGVTRP